MKKLNYNFAILYAKNLRSLHYLSNLKKFNMIPSSIITIPNNKITHSINKKHKIPIKKKEKVLNFFKTRSKIININNSTKNLLEKLSNLKEKYIIFAGNYGQILPENFFKIKKFFIHVHPGDLPNYKGSTTYYYEYINENKISFSSIYLNHKLDQGRILLKKTFNPKKIKFEKIDEYYDPILRSKVLIETLKKLKMKNKAITNKKTNSYYVIHPLIKYLAIFKSKN